MKCEIVGDCKGCKVSFFFQNLYCMYLLLALIYIYCILYQYINMQSYVYDDEL